MSICRSGFSLVEAIVSIVLVGVVFVGALEVVAQTSKSRAMMAQRSVAQAHAEALMAEVLARPYDDPDEADTSFGPSFIEESASGGAGVSRSGFDDVRDYAGWIASPPMQRDGTAMSALAGMKETIDVAYVDIADLTADAASDSGTLRITVTVQARDGRVLAELKALRSRTLATAEVSQ